MVLLGNINFIIYEQYFKIDLDIFFRWMNMFLLCKRYECLYKLPIADNNWSRRFSFIQFYLIGRVIFIILSSSILFYWNFLWKNNELKINHLLYLTACNLVLEGFYSDAIHYFQHRNLLWRMSANHDVQNMLNSRPVYFNKIFTQSQLVANPVS